MKVYYAHSKNLYNTPQEKRDIDTLESMGFEVFNPSAPGVESEFLQWLKDNNIELHAEGDKYLKFFHWKVDQCGVVAFRSFIDGKIGSGVFSELMYALEAGKPIFEMPTLLEERGLTHPQTVSYLKLHGER